MKTIQRPGRPPKPANKKRHLLSSTVSYEAFTGIRQYAADNSLELSSTVDRAIIAFLKAQSAPVVLTPPVAPITEIIPTTAAVPAQVEQPLLPAKKPRKPTPPIEGIVPKTYAEICEKLNEHHKRIGKAFDTATFLGMAGLSSGTGYKYIRQLLQDKYIKKIQGGVYNIIPENLPVPASIP